MENEVICLDTTVLIDYFRKTDKAKTFFYELSKKYLVFSVSVITEYEIFIGSNQIQDSYWNDFFKRIISLPYNSEVNKQTICIERELKRKKKQIDIPDVMIAATAIANNLKLATLNVKHFERIEGLKLITFEK